MLGDVDDRGVGHSRNRLNLLLGSIQTGTLAEFLLGHRYARDLVPTILKLELQVSDARKLDATSRRLHLDQRCDRCGALATILKRAKLLLCKLDRLAGADLIDHAARVRDIEGILAKSLL